MYEARPLGFPPNWPTLRGWQGFDFREDGKFSFFTFAADDARIQVHGSWELDVDVARIHITLPKDIGDAHTDLRVSEESAKDFTLEIVALEDEMLKVRVMEELPADDAQLAHDVNISVTFFRSASVWPRQD